MVSEEVEEMEEGEVRDTGESGGVTEIGEGKRAEKKGHLCWTQQKPNALMFYFLKRSTVTKVLGFSGRRSGRVGWF